MQILLEQSLVEALQQEWGGQAASNLTAIGPSQIARRNYELLVHRRSTAMAASELTCSTSTLSGLLARHPSTPQQPPHQLRQVLLDSILD